MTTSVTHLWRLLKWGRTLARHGALRGIEEDPMTPPPVRRLARLTRFGARIPPTPDYAAALLAIGPAAIKLGQALSTRPDLVGEKAAENFSLLQDDLPPAPFAKIKRTIETSFGAPLESLFSQFEEVPIGAASIAQVHRAVTTDGRHVAVKVLRPGIEQEFSKALETYEWAAAHVERYGAEAERLRPRLIVAHFKQWTARELDLQREAASASELRENMVAEPGYYVPEIDWRRTARRVLTLEWIDGIKLNDREALIEARHDCHKLAGTLVRAFLRQAVVDGFFHADLHHGNLFALPDGRIAAIDFGIMGRVDRRARMWLAEILYGLITGNYRRVAEIHFEAQYVPPHHNVQEFATALRAAGEPIRGLPVKDISVGRMLESLFSITRDFNMPTQPHLLLLQKTMVMNEGVATALDPDINMWETAEPFLKDWMRSELGPEAYYADRIIELVRAFKKIPELIDRIDEYYPPHGAAPPPPPLPEIAVVERPHWLAYTAVGLIGAMVGALLLFVLRGMAKVLLIVGGGIAAYKSLELVRLLKKGGHEVTPVLTRGGEHFVTAMSLGTLAESEVHSSLWELKDEVEIGHIQLSRAADFVLVCPATADLLAKMAAGIADDLATTLLLATDKPVVVAPAMNVRMWLHAATERNVAQLKADGVRVIEPAEGEMACGEFGPGRLREPQEIVDQLVDLLK